MLCSGPRFYTGKPREISIFFSNDPSLPALRATVQAYRSHEGAEDSGVVKAVDFPRNRVPSHGMLQQWVEGLIKRQPDPDFRQLVERFLLAYSEDGQGLPKVCKSPPDSWQVAVC